jgi:ribosomal protein S18 acetylase RimI-like enzyme
MNKLTCRTARRDEMPVVIEMAAREGWNPGLHDGPAFYAADPEGFLLAESAGRIVGCISAVSYGGASFGFIGLFIVAPELRGQGIGRLLWDAGMARLTGQVVGLDGVPAQQDYYRREGFSLAWQNVRFAGRAATSAEAPDDRIVPLDTINFAALCADDRRVFPAPREAFLRAWLTMPGARGLAWTEQGRLAGWGVIRPCREGYKIGPLLADGAGIAEALYRALCQQVPAGSTVYLDVPLPNTEALALANRLGLQRVFETARMYRGTAPACAIERVYGITSFELG